MTPKNVVALLALQGMCCTLATVVTGNLLWIAIGTVGGYVSQGIFVFYSTKRKPWELLFGVVIAMVAVVTGYLPLQFLGRVVFIGNAAHTAYKILEEKGY